jgi:CRP/FNR family cyclic AMP-dependent transcriptional regulator
LGVCGKRKTDFGRLAAHSENTSAGTWPFSWSRTLLLLARYGKESQPQKMLPKVSQEILAEIIGTTESRVNFFMNKFMKLGFIHYNGGLQVHNSLLSVALRD